MTRRSTIAAGSIGTRSSSRSRVRTKPPGCWLRWRGVPISWRARSSVSARRGSSLSRPSSSTWRSATPSFDQPQTWPDKRAGHILGQAQRLADLAHRAAGAVAADHRGQRGMVDGRRSRRSTGSPPRAAHARNRRRCRAARRGSSEMKRSNSSLCLTGSIEVMPST